MSNEIYESLQECFGGLEDPRSEINRVHRLMDMVVITICAVICGADDWEAVAEYGEAKQGWLSSFLALPEGIPSHDTFWRVFRRLNGEQFQQCFLAWVQSLASVLPQGVTASHTPEVIAIDGKQLRRSHDGEAGHAPIHLLSAWATEQQLVLGQLRVDEKSNEIVAIPALLKALDIAGSVVTIDAMGCQTGIAQQIVEQGGDYLLALKGNHPWLYEDVQLLFDNLAECGVTVNDASWYRQVHKGHGRIEIRQAWVVTDPAILNNLRGSEKWPHLTALVKLEAERLTASGRNSQSRYYLASWALSPQQAITLTRSHWCIENSLHWVLDMAFREDESRLRKDYGAHNFAILRHIALNLLKQEKTNRLGVKNKRLRAAWDNDYLLRVLAPLFA